MQSKKLGRREFLRMSALTMAGTALAACAPQLVKETVVVEKPVEKIVKETVVVEKEVEKVVKETVVAEKVVTATPAPPEPFELRVNTRGAGILGPHLESVLDQFKEIVPDAEVKVEVVPGGALVFATKLMVLAAGGQVGDVVWSASRAGFNRRFMGVGITMPLDDLIAADGYDMGVYYPNCVAEVTYEGKVMALPYSSEPGQVGLEMNLDLWDEAGAEPLTMDSSMDDLIEAASAVTEKTGVFGFGRDANYFHWVTHIRSFGGDLLDPEGIRCVLLDNDGALQAAQQLYDMVYEYEFAYTPSQMDGWCGKMFQGGTLASMPSWPSYCTAWPDVVEFRMGSTMLPPGPAGRGSMLNQHMYSVAMASDHPEAAWELVKWHCGAETARERMMIGLCAPPGMPSLWHDEEWLSKYPCEQPWSEIFDNVGPNYTAANLRGKEVEDAFNQGVQAIMSQAVGIEEGLENLTEEIQKVLDKDIAI